MKLEALLFDVDGTLADTEELHRQSFNQTFLDFGFGWNWDPELYQDLLHVSGGADRIARYLDIIDLSAAEKTRLRRLIPAIHREKTSTYGELMRGNSVRLRPGVARLVEEARQAGVRIGLAATSASANVQALIATAFGRLRGQYPGISIDVAPVGAISEQHRKLRERNVDLVVGRVGQSHEEDIDTEVLFNDRVVIVAGLENPWSRRRKVGLSELADEPWAMPPADTPVGGVVAELFRARGLKFPPRGMARGSVHLACSLIASGPFLGFLAVSVLRFGANLPPLKILPVKLSMPPLPVGIMTLKNRTISPVGRLFIDRLRELARPLARQRP